VFAVSELLKIVICVSDVKRSLATPVVYRRMVRWLMNNELEGIWEEVAVE
jgi:hypothetical protein